MSSSNEDQTLSYFEQNAERYCSRTNLKIDREAITRFAELLPPRGWVLDAGCGSGRDLKTFSSLGFQTEGFDGSEKMLTIARAQLPESTRLWRSDFRFLQLNKEHYNGIWANQSLIHLPPILCLRTVQTFFSALKPGGVLFVSFSQSEKSETEQELTDGPNGPPAWIYSYPFHEFASLLRQSGFQPLLSGKVQDGTEIAAVLARRI